MIASKLDNDYYNFTMGQVVWKHYRHLPVRYAFKNRTLSVRLSEHISVNELREHLDAIRALRFTADELEYLRRQTIFSPGYLDFLAESRLPEVEVEDRDGWLSIEYEGAWPDAIFWETPLLSTVNDLYYRSVIADQGHSYMSAEREGRKRLTAKIGIYHDHPDMPGFLEFGTRRRFRHEWQERVLAQLVAELPQKLVGTSNPYFAMLYDIPVSGTMAHQMPMVVGAKFVNEGTSPYPLETAYNHVLDLWENEYAHFKDGAMLIALPDTWGTPFFLGCVGYKRMANWRGMRQDSGSPIAMGELIVDYYKRGGLEDKLLVPSDALDMNKMLSIFYHFNGRVQLLYGLGTDLTNDVGYPTISIVVKPKTVDGRWITVKTSDDLTKATGTVDEVNRYKELARRHLQNE